MKHEILKDVMIELGEVEKYLGNIVPLTLWRALNRQNAPAGAHMFNLVERPILRDGNNPRPADITIFERAGRRWVSCRYFPRGISTFDKPNVFKGNSWSYYTIPEGTVLPHGLVIVEDEFNRRYKATHYTIAPAWDMDLDYFKELLRQLAEIVIRKAA